MRKITDRQAQLLKILSAGDTRHTFQALGALLGVSARTVARELEACESYLKTAGLLLERRSDGVRLTGAGDAVAALQSELEKKTYVANQTQRLILLKLKLLQQNEPMKLYALSKALNVAESTVSHDLGKAAAWLEGYSLKLTRRQGFGIALEGTEPDRRNALAGLVYESLSDTLLVRWLTGEPLLKDHAKDAFLLQWLDVDMAAEIAAQLRLLHCEDKDLVALTLHLLIIVSRVKSGCSCEGGAPLGGDALPQYEQAEKLAKQLERKLAVQLSEEEICCIAAHLRNRRAGDDKERQYALSLAREFLLEVWEESDFTFVYDEGLAEAVADHLSAALYRLRLQMKIRNPLEKEIKECYAQSFEITRRALRVIERQEKLRVPDAEAAYLTMYLLAALENGKAAEPKVFHVAVCCPFGMSSAVLLTSRLQSLYKNIVVEHMLSITRLEEVKGQDVDLILSTVDGVSCGIDLIRVSPLFTEEDQKKLDEWLGAHPPKRRTMRAAAEPDWKKRLLQINELSEGLIRFLNRVFFTFCDVKGKEEAIRRAAIAAEAAGESRAAVETALRERELKGSVIVEAQNLLFLHARADTIRDLHFGVLRPEKEFATEGIVIRTVVVMLVPSRATRSQVGLLQKLTALIAEDESFQRLLGRCTGEELQASLERVFRQYFKEKFVD